jgi:nitrogenase molybdenum-iron protein alpha/beta subunit
VLLEEATEVEKRHGAASKEYLAPSRGDLKYKVAQRIIELLREGKKGLVIMNAKKETGYMFADINVAVNEVASQLGVSGNVVNMANLDESLGLPRVRDHARNITNDLKEKGVQVHEITGGLDEYPIAGNVVNELINKKYADYDLLCHGCSPCIPMDHISNMEIISLQWSPQVLPLKERVTNTDRGDRPAP